MKIYKNFFYEANTDRYHIMNNPYVLATEPVAILDTNIKVEEPLVVEDDFGLCHIFDRKSYEETHRRFFLRVNEDGTLVEAKPGEKFHFFKWHTKETDVSKLRFDGKRIFMIDTEEEPNVEEEKPNKKRDKTKEN